MKNVRRLKLLQKALLLIVLLGIAIAGLIFAGIPKRASAIVIVAPGSGKDLKVTISVCYPGDGPSYESRYSSSDVNASLFYVGSKDNIVISLDGDGGIIEHVGFKWFYGDDTGVVGDANAAFTDKTTKIWKVSDWLTGAHVHDILAIQCYYLSDLFGTTTEARYYFNFKIDSTAPAVSMSNEYYNANDSTYYIKNAQTMTFSDSESGFSRSEIKKNSEASVTSPASAYTFSSSGTYTVTVIDRVDNKSVYTVKYDDQLPTGKFTNSSAVEIADYTRDPFRFVFSDIGDSGVKTSTLTRPGQAPEDYTSGYIQQNAADGRYTFTVTDYANNVLIKSIVFDTETPEGVFENAQLLPASAEYYARTDQTARFSWTAATPSEAPVSATLDGQSYASGTAITAAGRHAVVIRDAVNHSRTYYLTIDKTLPTGRFTDYYGVELSLYTSDDFRFVFSDSGGSGLKSGTLMRPGEEAKDYTAYTNISASSGDGLYVFTVEDYAGNVLTKSIVLDTTAPAGVFDKAQLLPNKTDEYYAKSTDTARFSWTAATPSEAPVSVTLDEQSYAINTPIAGAGRHTVVISDGAGNKTTYYLIIDKTAPTGRITDNSGAELEAYTRGSFRFTFSDSGGSGLKSATLTRPGQAPEDYTAYTNISASSGDGLYVFTVEDYAGNVFSRSITLDITAPTAIVKNAAGNSVTDYINAAFRLFGEDITSPVTCQIKTPGGAWTAHTAGTYIDPASGDGLYEFRVTDDAGNTSTVNITLDTVTPEITLNPNTSIYNKQIIFTASDINFSGIYYRNGGGAYSFTSAKSYTVAATSANNAAWSFYAADAAGNNSAVRTIILDTVAAVHGSLPEYTKDNITFAPTDLNGIAETY
ncbi:MAG: hypothetical protein LBS99_03020, partial [Clostridiales bacterium]|nr:hypothetical protein [Clostridiales bacterium]